MNLEKPVFSFYFVFQSTFMDTSNPSLETLQDIRRIMDRSSRFISLSGLSGISAGLFGLAGAGLGYQWITEYTRGLGFDRLYRAGDLDFLEWKLLLLACAVLLGALVSAFYFTWRKATRDGLPFWDHSSRRLLANLLVPLIAGGIFIAALWYHNDLQYVAPVCLVFYGLALVNASKYTVSDIRYMGLCEIALGLAGLFFVGYGLLFWALGFGLLHIVHGMLMWWKYERKAS
jgi:hypothetical protein